MRPTSALVLRAQSAVSLQSRCAPLAAPSSLFARASRKGIQARPSSSWGPAASDGDNPYAVNKEDLRAARGGKGGGAMATGQGLGVFSESEDHDLEMLINNFTAPALARALREREATLHTAAYLLEGKDYHELTRVLRPFMRTSVEQRRVVNTDWDVSRGFTKVRFWPAWKCISSPVSAHIQAHQPIPSGPRHHQAAVVPHDASTAARSGRPRQHLGGLHHSGHGG